MADRGGPRVDALYNLMQSFENKLGGGEGIEGLYGSITQNSMQKVLDCLRRNCGLDIRSTVVDIGAGLGRPLLHAMVDAGVSAAWGVELDRVKCDKAAAFLGHVLHHMVERELLPPGVQAPHIICSPVEKVSTLDPATHAYSFWEGVPTTGKQAFGALFASSRSLRAVAVVQRAMRGQTPALVMRELGFGPLLLITSFPVKMSGSGRSFTAYVFSKITPAAAGFLGAAGTAAAPPLAAVPVASPVAAVSGAAPRRQRHGTARTGTPQRQAVVEEGPTTSGRDETAPGAARAGSKTVELAGGSSARLVEADDLFAASAVKARKPDGEPAPVSPSKKPCPTSREASPPGSPTATRPSTAVACGSVAAERQGPAEGQLPVAAACVPEPATVPRPRGARAGAAQRQQALTNIAAFSRRTTQAAVVGKAAAAKGAAAGHGAGAAAAGAPAPAATRSSSRLAAKALDVALAASLLEGVAAS
ncbi:hypothetical protein TSOC_011949 [Tetrabaena socialis]|uniref:DOT1 domain-containing protein n=1 Tax=Tetrabaena socialis TaxID=47790 RepID=A0A2J7ZPB0_9CHLO|nr:hypothetical protein TSOC_011949 [Tetrabaena socialis]|eukprot:PNH02098.1 hypothetical protein TSOC_011949 [Tetrabaena socialis]